MTPKELGDMFYDWVSQQNTGDLHVLMAAATETEAGILVSTVIGSPDANSRALDESIIRLAVRIDSQRESPKQVIRRAWKDSATGEWLKDIDNGSLAN